MESVESIQGTYRQKGNGCVGQTSTKKSYFEEPTRKIGQDLDQLYNII